MPKSKIKTQKDKIRQSRRGGGKLEMLESHVNSLGNDSLSDLFVDADGARVDVEDSVSFATEFKHTHVDMIVGQRQNHNVWKKLICLILVKRNVQLVSYCVCLLVDLDEVFVVNGVTKSDLQVILLWLCSKVKSFLSSYLSLYD